MTTQATPAAQPVESLVESVIALGTSLVRLGVNVGTIPLALLPADARQSTVKATHEVLTAVEKINVSVFKTASRVASTWLKEIDTALTAAAAPAAEAKQVVIEKK